ncbi:MAG: TRM11 family SAM-dependent methyltransferase [Promethearchaeota archaeon]
MKIPSLFTLKSQIKLDPQPVNSKNQLFIFGRNPELSLAELCALYHTEESQPNFVDLTIQGAITKSQKNPDISKSGALLKQADIISQIFYEDFSDTILSTLIEHFNAEYVEDKSFWAISFYNRDRTSLTSGEFAQLSENFHLVVKTCLKKLKIRRTQRINEYQQDFLSPRKLKRKEVIERGFELIVWFQPEQIILAHTRKIIDIDEFARRDAKRLYRRPLLLLGLALARSMINLISIQENRHNLPVYDPFCGMGTIPAEAFLLGINAYGSDIDHDCVVQSRENLQWLFQQKKYRRFSRFYEPNHIFEMDITSPQSQIFPWEAPFRGSIVAETNLLTPRKTYPSRSEAIEMMHEFEYNYSRYISGILSILPPMGVCVLVFPQIHLKSHDRLQFPIKEMLKGYNCRILSYTVNNLEIPAVFVHKWKNPIIERVIVVFQKAK